MEVSGFLIRITFLLLPGLISRKVYHVLVGRVERKKWEDFLEILLFALASYVIYGAAVEGLNSTLHLQLQTVTVFEKILDKDIQISWYEITWASVVGLVLSFLASLIHTRQLVSRIGRLLKVTRRLGDEDVWDYFHNIQDLEWVFVRDHKLDLVYYGWVQVFSDSEKPRELILRDVQVFRNVANAEVLYEVPVMYLARQADDLIIEAPPSPTSSDNRSNGQ